jgi:uncharacterized protein with HEPN domain
VPPREWKLRVADILESISAIQEYVHGMDYRAFHDDRRTVDAVVRHLAIIGEAAGSVPEHITSAHPGIPWRRMRDVRNVVVHVYFAVRKDVLWGTIVNDLPPLVPLLRRLLEVEAAGES